MFQSQYIERIIGVIIILIIIYCLPIFVDTPNKAVRSGAISYLKKMNQFQVKSYQKTGNFLTSVNYFDLEFGYLKERGKPEGKLIPINPEDAVKNGYITVNKSGFETKYHQYFSYQNDNIAVNIAIPKTIYYFGNKNYFFWYKMYPLDSYFGMVIINNTQIKNYICTLKYPQENILLLIKNNLNNLSKIVTFLKESNFNYCQNYED